MAHSKHQLSPYLEVYCRTFAFSGQYLDSRGFVAFDINQKYPKEKIWGKSYHIEKHDVNTLSTVLRYVRIFCLLFLM